MMLSGIAPRPAVIIIAANGMLNQRFMMIMPLAWYIRPSLRFMPKCRPMRLMRPESRMIVIMA